MKIGLVSPYVYPLPGGVTQHVRYLYENLRLRGHDVRILTSSHGLQRSSEGDVIRLGKGFSMPANGSVGTVTVSPRFVSQARDVLDRERFDVLHFHEPFVPFLSLVLLRESQSVNIGTFHAYGGWSPAYEFGRWAMGSYAGRLHGRIAVSAAARHFIDRYFPGDYKVIPNGVDVDRFQRAVPVARWQDGTANILFVGRFEPRKGVLDLLKAYRNLRARASTAGCSSWVAGRRSARRGATSRPGACRAWSSWAGSPTTRSASCSAPRTSTCRRRRGASRSASCCSRRWPPGPRSCLGHPRLQGRGPAGPEGLLVEPREPKELSAAIGRLLRRPRAGRLDVGRRGAPRRGVQLAAGHGQGRRLLRVRDPAARRRGRPAGALHGRCPALAARGGLARDGARGLALARLAGCPSGRARLAGPIRARALLGLDRERLAPRPGGIADDAEHDHQRNHQQRERGRRERDRPPRSTVFTANWNAYR